MTVVYWTARGWATRSFADLGRALMFAKLYKKGKILCKP